MTPVIFHNSKELQRRGTGPYFYLRKLESHLKVRVWSNISCFAEDELCVPGGSIRAAAAVLIEAIQPCSKRVKSSMNVGRSISTPGCADRAASRFATSWKEPQRQKFATPKSGNATSMMPHNQRQNG